MIEKIRRKAARCKAHGLKPNVLIYPGEGAVLHCSGGCDYSASETVEQALEEWNRRHAGFFRRHPVIAALIVAAAALLIWVWAA